MNRDFWYGVAAIPLALLGLAALLVGVLGLLWLWGHFAPPHWWFSGPGKLRPADEVFQQVNVAGGHAESLRKLARVGPWSLLLVRYAPGHVEERERERIP